MNMRLRRGRVVNSDAVAATRNEIARRTATMNDTGGLRVDPARLDGDELLELVELTDRVGELDERERLRWEALVERGADAAGTFESARNRAVLQRLAADETRKALRRPLGRREQVTLFGELDRQLVAGALHIEHIAVLLVLLMGWHRGAPVGRGEFKPGPDGMPVLHVNVHNASLLANLDPDRRVANWPRALDHLAKNSWFDVQKSGPNWAIALGARARRALGLTAKAKAA